MLEYKENLDMFLSMRIPNKNKFRTEYTLKFFKQGDLDKQNSILINPFNNTIVDMKIVDQDVFNKIVETFSDGEQGTEYTKALRETIDIYVFLEKIINNNDHRIIGFISQGQMGEDNLLIPGSIVLNFTIL